jgi:hypothetical protein
MKRKITTTILLGVSLLFTANLNAQDHPTNGLVEYFSFNNNLNGSEGAVFETTQSNFTTGYLGDLDGAYNLDGTTNELISGANITGYPASNTDFTVGFWFKLNVNTFASLFNYRGYDGDILPQNIYATGLAYNGANKLIISKAEMNNFTEAEVNFTYNSAWHHFAWKHIESGNSNFIYIDGAFIGAPNMQLNTPSYINSKLQIGQSPGGAHFGDFDIDEFLIYNRVLSSDEVIAIASLSANLGENSIEQLELYPNPTQSLLNIKLSKPATLTILDVLGTKMASYSGVTGINSIDVSNLSNGMYFVESADFKKVRFVKH